MLSAVGSLEAALFSTGLLPARWALGDGADGDGTISGGVSDETKSPVTNHVNKGLPIAA